MYVAAAFQVSIHGLKIEAIETATDGERTTATFIGDLSSPRLEVGVRFEDAAVPCTSDAGSSAERIGLLWKSGAWWNATDGTAFTLTASWKTTSASTEEITDILRAEVARAARYVVRPRSADLTAGFELDISWNRPAVLSLGDVDVRCTASTAIEAATGSVEVVLIPQGRFPYDGRAATAWFRCTAQSGPHRLRGSCDFARMAYDSEPTTLRSRNGHLRNSRHAARRWLQPRKRKAS